LKDHLGNSRVTFADLDNNGTINPLTEILQENHYYPFGLNQDGKWLNNAALPDTKYQYNGKELNEDLGLNWNDYGARWYDAAIGRWNAIDPLSEKYTRWSPYNYTADNPVKFRDPNGKEIWIYYKDKNGKEQKIDYNVNMKYKGSDKFVASVVTQLNKIAGTKQGESVIKNLDKSKNSFDFKNSQSAAGSNSFQFKPYESGGGEIKSAAILNPKINEGQKVENVAHELFHGYQKENNRNAATTNGEVEAYLFGKGVALSANYGISSFGTESKEGRVYDDAMSKMMYEGFDKKSFKDAADNFTSGSIGNAECNGCYKNTKPDVNYQPLIDSFLPF
jgi:RHS repeat-associated protein